MTNGTQLASFTLGSAHNQYIYTQWHTYIYIHMYLVYCPDQELGQFWLIESKQSNGKCWSNTQIQPLKIIYASYIDHSFWLLTPVLGCSAGQGGWGIGGMRIGCAVATIYELILAVNICLVMSRRRVGR